MTDEELNRKLEFVASALADLSVSQQKAEERMGRADERTSRLERTLLLAIRAGRRERREWREHFRVLADAQMRLEEKFTRARARNETMLAEFQARNEALLADSEARIVKMLAEAQARNEAAFASLAEIQGRLADSQRKLADSQANLADSQANLADSQAKLSESQAKLAEAQANLAEAQAHTDRRLDALIDIVRERLNGKGE